MAPGGESGKSYKRRLAEGFYDRWLGGEVILDIGCGGSRVLPRAIGIDWGYPDYDGIHLPFADETVDAVYSSHMPEHTPDPAPVIRDWHRVLKLGGFIVCIVPHQFLYEKQRDLPSRWNPDHRRFYTPASLLREVEDALAPNSYRVRHLVDNDHDFDYAIDPGRPMPPAATRSSSSSRSARRRAGSSPDPIREFSRRFAPIRKFSRRFAG